MSAHPRFEYHGPMGTPRLVTAVLADDVAKMKTLLRYGRNVNIEDRSDGNTPLHVAVLNNKYPPPKYPQINYSMTEIRFQAFDYLLTVEGLALDAINYSGQTPLLLACRTSTTSPYFIGELLDKGADINTEDHFENTPLLSAVLGHKDPDVISRLIRHGSCIDHRNWERQTALHLACLERSAECVSTLLYWGVDPWVYDTKEQLPFDLAVHGYARDIVELLFPYYFDCFSSFEVGLNTIVWTMRFKCDFFQDMVNNGKLRITFDDDDLTVFAGYLLDLDSEWLQGFVGPLNEVWEALFEPGTSTLNRMLVNYSYSSEKTIKAQNLCLLFSDHTVGPMMVEHANTSITPGMITALTASAHMDKVSVDKAVEIIFCMLSYGVNLTALDLVSIYQRFGHCALFSDLLYMDIVGIESPMYEEVEALIPGIYFDLRHGVEYYMSRRKFVWDCKRAWIRHCEVRLAKELLGLFADSRLNDQIVRDFERVHFDDEVEVLVAMARERRFPSLLELGRNASREYILEVLAVRNTRQYYAIVANLPLAKLHRDVLLFREPIYFYN